MNVLLPWENYSPACCMNDYIRRPEDGRAFHNAIVIPNYGAMAGYPEIGGVRWSAWAPDGKPLALSQWAPSYEIGQRNADDVLRLHDWVLLSGDPLFDRIERYAATLERTPIEPDLYGLQGLYMRRFLIHRFQDGSSLRLHHILRPDEDEEFHNHPWGDRFGKTASRALILFGGYEEERRGAWSPGQHGWAFERHVYRRGDVSFLRTQDYHRLTRILHPLGSWSLFWTAPKYEPWSFWNPRTEIYTPWREFIERKFRARG